MKNGWQIITCVALGLVVVAGMAAWILWPRGGSPWCGGSNPIVSESPVLPVLLPSDERAKLAADADRDGLPDEWERKYFGSITKYGPADCPAGDNVPNIFKYHAGLNPNVKWTPPADPPKFSVNIPGNAKVRYDSRARFPGTAY